MKKQQPKIEDILIDIPDHPDLHKVIENKFPHYLLHRDGFYHCGNCGKRYGKVMSELLFNNQGSCPNCGVEFVKKQISRRTNWNNLITEHRIEVFQVHEGRIAFRQYEAVHSVDRELREQVEVKEIQRDTVYQGRIHQCVYREKYYTKEKLWMWGWINENDRIRRPKESFYIYPKSMAEALKGTEVQYTGVGQHLDDELKDRGKGYFHWYARRYIANAAYAPWVEYVKKMKFNNLYQDIIEGRADMRLIRPNLIKRYRQYIKANEASASMVRTKRMCEIVKVEVSDETIKTLNSSYIKEIVKIASKTTMSFEKVCHYVESPDFEKWNYGYYNDYLNMMAEIGTPATTEQLAFPKDLRAVHDDAVNKLNIMKSEIANADYEAIYQKLKKLELMDNDLRIIVPKNLNEILQEGKDQNHCVGSYVDRVAKGETAILFIRQSTSPLEAFYTMEYKGGKIVQIRGKHNKDATPEVKAFTDQWLEWTKKKPKKQKQPVMQLQAVNA